MRIVPSVGGKSSSSPPSDTRRWREHEAARPERGSLLLQDALRPGGRSRYCDNRRSSAGSARVRRTYRPSQRARGPTSTAMQDGNPIVESSRRRTRSAEPPRASRLDDTTSSRPSTLRAPHSGRAGTARTSREAPHPPRHRDRAECRTSRDGSAPLRPRCSRENRARARARAR